MSDIDALTPEQMILKALNSRLKRMERMLGEIQAEVEDTADDVQEIKDIIGMTEDEQE